MPTGGRELQGWEFVENSRRGRGAAWSLQVQCDAGVAVVKELVGEGERRRFDAGFHHGDEVRGIVCCVSSSDAGGGGAVDLEFSGREAGYCVVCHGQDDEQSAEGVCVLLVEWRGRDD